MHLIAAAEGQRIIWFFQLPQQLALWWCFAIHTQKHVQNTAAKHTARNKHCILKLLPLFVITTAYHDLPQGVTNLSCCHVCSATRVG